MTKLSTDQQAKAIEVLRELDQSARNLSEAIVKFTKLAGIVANKNERAIAALDELHSGELDDDQEDELVINALGPLAELSRLSEDIGISPDVITNLRFSLKGLWEDGFQSTYEEDGQEEHSDDE